MSNIISSQSTHLRTIQDGYSSPSIVNEAATHGFSPRAALAAALTSALAIASIFSFLKYTQRTKASPVRFTQSINPIPDVLDLKLATSPLLRTQILNSGKYYVSGNLVALKPPSQVELVWKDEANLTYLQKIDGIKKDLLTVKPEAQSRPCKISHVIDKTIDQAIEERHLEAPGGTHFIAVQIGDERYLDIDPAISLYEDKFYVLPSTVKRTGSFLDRCFLPKSLFHHLDRKKNVETGQYEHCFQIISDFKKSVLSFDTQLISKFDRDAIDKIHYFQHPIDVGCVVSGVKDYRKKERHCSITPEAEKDALARIQTHLLAAAEKALSMGKQNPSFPVILVLNEFADPRYAPSNFPDYQQLTGQIYREELARFEGLFDEVIFVHPPVQQLTMPPLKSVQKSLSDPWTLSSAVAERKTGDPSEVKTKAKKDKTNLTVAHEGMRKNLGKALLEHQKETKNPYVTVDEMNDFLKEGEAKEPLCYVYDAKTDRGKGEKRIENEDAHFFAFIKTKDHEGLLAGVLDGHSPDHRSGKELTEFVANNMHNLFKVELENPMGNVLAAFETAFTKMQELIRQNLKTKAGSTAVICYIDKKTSCIYTATLGDSEAFICREINGIGKLIPLSVVRNWASDKDAERAGGGQESLLYNTLDRQHPVKVTAKEIKAGWKPFDPKTKNLRIMRNLNLSRSFGDFAYWVGGRGIIQKPKTTEFFLRKGDRLILVCDGITDYLSKELIRYTISLYPDPDILASELIREAKENMSLKDGDNATVVVINVTEQNEKNPVFMLPFMPPKPLSIPYQYD